MKSLLAVSFLFILVSCKKLKDELRGLTDKGTVTATVIEEGGAVPGYFIVALDNPDNTKYSFICADAPMPGPAGYNCRNSIYVTNLPAFVKFAGTRISFRRYKDLGRHGLWSSTYAASDVEIYDVKKL